MALNIQNAEIEKLADEAAELAGESRTEAVRQALRERVRRLRGHRAAVGSDERIQALLARFRTEFPHGDFGRGLPKTEKEEILGYGHDGV